MVIIFAGPTQHHIPSIPFFSPVKPNHVSLSFSLFSSIDGNPQLLPPTCRQRCYNLEEGHRRDHRLIALTLLTLTFFPLYQTNNIHETPLLPSALSSPLLPRLPIPETVTFILGPKLQLSLFSSTTAKLNKHENHIEIINFLVSDF